MAHRSQAKRRHLLRALSAAIAASLSLGCFASSQGERSYYVLQGFSEVEIGPVQVTGMDDKLHLTIPIREGPRRRVVELRFPGLEKLDPEAVRAELPLKRGCPFQVYLRF